MWLMADYPRKPSIKPLVEPVREAIQALEHAGLLLRRTSSDGASTVDLTRLGETALAEGNIRKHL